MDCSITNRKGCNYCMRNKTINTSGDDFSITKDKKDKRYFISTGGVHSFIMDITYCPICGKKLVKY